MKYLLCFLLLSLPMYGQTELRKPDYIYMEDEVFIEIYQDQDSVRTNERYFENFEFQDDFYSYKNLQAFKEEWDVEEGGLIEYSLLKPIPKNLVSKEIRFENVIGNDMYFRFLENNWVHLYTRVDNEYYRFTKAVNRYLLPDVYDGKILIILAYGSEITMFYMKESMDWNTGEYIYDGWKSAEALSKPYLIESKSKWIPPFEFGYGFEIREHNNKYGVYDLILDKLVLDYLYDEIKLERNVIVRNGGVYGLLDYYGKELMPLEFKMISYSDNDLQYLTKENQLFYKNYKKEIIRPEDVDYEKWTPSYENRESVRGSWKFIKKQDGFYLISTHYKNPDEFVEKRIKIRNWEQYNRIVFASGESENDGVTYQVVFAEKASGKYDMFYHDANPDFSIAEKDLDGFDIRYLPYGFVRNYYNFYH